MRGAERCQIEEVNLEVGMRSTILDDSKEDRSRFNQLLQDADVFFANKRPGFLKKHDLDAEVLCEQKPGLIHATVVMHGEKGPWSSCCGRQTPQTFALRTASKFECSTSEMGLTRK